MKKLHLSLIATAVLFMAAPAFADSAPNTVAIVNIQQIMQDSTAAKSVREQLESKQKAFQADVTKKQDALQKEKQELDKKQSVLSKEAYGEKEHAFLNKVTTARKDMDSKKALLDNAFSRSLGDIQKAVTDIIADLAKEKGFAVTIPSSELLYADPKLDITEEVLKRLNQKLPKLSVKFDAE
jgi:Skp family chaperone for outer membrane proteins